MPGNQRLRATWLVVAVLAVAALPALAAVPVRVMQPRAADFGEQFQLTGTLTAEARLLELAGNVRLTGMGSSTLTGTEQVQLNAVGASATIETVGDLTLRGGVVTPGHNAQVTVKATGRDVRVESVGTAALAPQSALGRLRIEAYDSANGVGQKRAEALRDALVAAGVASNRIQLAGKKAASTQARSAEVIIAP